MTDHCNQILNDDRIFPARCAKPNNHEGNHQTALFHIGYGVLPTPTTWADGDTTGQLSPPITTTHDPNQAILERSRAALSLANTLQPED